MVESSRSETFRCQCREVCHCGLLFRLGRIVDSLGDADDRDRTELRQGLNNAIEQLRVAVARSVQPDVRVWHKHGPHRHSVISAYPLRPLASYAPHTPQVEQVLHSQAAFAVVRFKLQKVFDQLRADQEEVKPHLRRAMEDLQEEYMTAGDRRLNSLLSEKLTARLTARSGTTARSTTNLTARSSTGRVRGSFSTLATTMSMRNSETLSARSSGSSRSSSSSTEEMPTLSSKEASPVKDEDEPLCFPGTLTGQASATLRPMTVRGEVLSRQPRPSMLGGNRSWCLSHLGYGDEHMAMFCAGLPFHCRLSLLDLSNNKISNVSELGNVLNACKSLRQLFLRSNDIEDIGGLSQSLAQNTTIQDLDLSCNKIACILTLGSALITNNALRNLDVGSNEISDVREFMVNVHLNSALKMLCLHANPIADISPLQEAQSRFPNAF
mmetsp:Transcript_53768/g.96667  ORF Transcript_53768/g.96667 Transcript_53768/m.96667 type:complete len:439 (+) Transcript_53768:118-1434(+)